MTNLESILKNRDITLLTKVLIVKAMVFPVVMYGCESWTKSKAECWRIDAFELWWWKRLFRVPWTARRSNLSILKEINPEYWLEGLMLRLKLQYFGHLMWRADSLEKTLKLAKTEDKRRRRWQRTRWLDSFTDSMDMNLSKLWEIVGEGNGNPFQCSCLENTRDGGAWWAAVYGVSRSRTRLKQFSSSSSSREIVEDRGGWHATILGFTKSWTRLSNWTTTTTPLLSQLHNLKISGQENKKDTCVVTWLKKNLVRPGQFLLYTLH